MVYPLQIFLPIPYQGYIGADGSNVLMLLVVVVLMAPLRLSLVLAD